MEYIYAALLLNKLKQEVNEANVKNVVKATGVEPDEIRVKALVSALGEINIEEASIPFVLDMERGRNHSIGRW